MNMKKNVIFVFALVLLVGSAFGKDSQVPSSTVLGLFKAEEKALLPPAFINAVTRYLRRYEAKIVTQSENHIEMSAKYDYKLKIELRIKEAESRYEIIVTVAEKRFSSNKGQTICNKIVTGAQKVFLDQMVIVRKLAGE